MPQTWKSSILRYPSKISFVGDRDRLDASRTFVSGLFIVRDLSPSYVREYFCPPGRYYILYLWCARVTGKENGSTLFSTGEKSRKSREDPSTSSKKRVKDGQADRKGGGMRAEGLARSIRGRVFLLRSSHDQAGLLQFRGYP